jgi:glycine/D-amino acid oxidase-like deaminating enzyme
LERSGGILLCGKSGGLERIREASEPAGVRMEPLDREGVSRRFPFLGDSPIRAAYHCPDDGLVDIHAYLGAFLRGIPLEVGSGVEAFEREGSRINRVVTTRGAYEARRVVLACGSYNALMGRLAGGVALPMVPRRRHLVFTGPLEWIPRGIPYAWFQSPEAYFKPESGGLLLSPCDEADASPDPPGADPEAPSWLYGRLKEVFPGLVGIPIARTWAELRCFVPDRRFAIGRDPRIENLTWVAALGGHGMTSAAAVGELASALVLEEKPPVDPAPYDPARFE